MPIFVIISRLRELLQAEGVINGKARQFFALGF